LGKRGKGTCCLRKLVNAWGKTEMLQTHSVHQREVKIWRIERALFTQILLQLVQFTLKEYWSDSVIIVLQTSWSRNGWKSRDERNVMMLFWGSANADWAKLARTSRHTRTRKARRELSVAHLPRKLSWLSQPHIRHVQLTEDITTVFSSRRRRHTSYRRSTLRWNPRYRNLGGEAATDSQASTQSEPCELLNHIPQPYFSQSYTARMLLLL
jgi:hypothetical protein